MPWKDEREPLSNIVWEDKLTWFKSSSFEHNWLWANGIRVEYFSGSTTLQLCNRVQQFLSKMSEKPEEFTGRIIFMSMFNDISWWSKENKQECESCAQLVSIYAKRFSSGRWSFLGHGSEKKWYSTLECKPQGEGDRIAELMMLKFGEGKHPVFRSTSPLSRGVLKSKGGGNLSIHFCADEGKIETVFRTIISVNQLSIYGAVSDLCDECKPCHVRTGRLVLAGQSDPLFVPKIFVDENTYTFDRWSCARRYLAKVPRTSGKALTTKSCDQILYRCRILDNSWSRTVLHDERHSRILTIYRFSGMSWMKCSSKILR